MRKHHGSRLLLLLMLGLIGALSNQTAGATNPIGASALDRPLEPVILNASMLPAFVGTSVDDLFVYSYKGGSWTQIPFQVDEISQADKYVAVDDGIFNSRATGGGTRFDEIVFMAKDAGEKASGQPSQGDQPISQFWYEVQLTNPLNSSATGWVYVVHSTTLAPNFSGDYVNFDTTTRQLTGQTYELRFFTASDGRKKQWIDVLRVGNAGSRGPDIVDRTPGIEGCTQATCLTEDGLGNLADDQVIKDGPVRVIMRDGRVRAYGSTVAWSVAVPAFPLAPTFVRFSTDFNAAASGAKLFNAATPGSGVTIDGNPDAVPETPFSRWWQVATGQGSVIHVGNYSSLGGSPTNYYVDNASAPDVTGEAGHYGDIGATITNPRNGFTFDFTFYFLAGNQSNVGAQYQNYFDQPFAASMQLHDGRSVIYLPLVAKQ